MASESILDTIKPMIGIQPEETIFDLSLIAHLNSIFMVLHQLGIGPDSVFVITDNSETWDLFLVGDDEKYFALVKSYIALKLQLFFDPPTSGIVSSSLDRVLSDVEARLVAQAEVKEEETL